MLEGDSKRSEVGEFTGRYAIQVNSCFDPYKNIPTAEGRLDSSHSNGGSNIDALKKWASQQVEDHLKGHKFWGTPPCQPTISPIYEAHKSATKSNRIVWVPTAL